MGWEHPEPPPTTGEGLGGRTQQQLGARYPNPGIWAPGTKGWDPKLAGRRAPDPVAAPGRVPRRQTWLMPRFLECSLPRL